MVPAVAPLTARCLLLSGLLALSIWGPVPAAAQTGPRFTLPLGFVIDVFADGVGSVRLMALDPAGTILVGESGIRTAAEIRKLGAAGAHAVLIGEHLMRALSPGDALGELVKGLQ